MGKIGSILTDLVIDISIIEHSEWCTPIDGSGIKIATLPENVFRVYYALLRRQRRDAKDDKWPKLLKLEMSKTQAVTTQRDPEAKASQTENLLSTKRT